MKILLLEYTGYFKGFFKHRTLMKQLNIKHFKIMWDDVGAKQFRLFCNKAKS